MLRAIAWISLIIGPVLLLVFFQLQFLPYHNEAVSWWQRIAVLLDLVLLWILWPTIARGSALRWHELYTYEAIGLLALSAVPVQLVFTVATFPGEWLDDNIPEISRDSTESTLHQLLVAGEVDEVRQRPRSLWSNRLVLPEIDVIDRAKYDTEAKIAAVPVTVSLRGRRLEGAVLTGAKLRKVDFTGAQLQGASLRAAQLQGAHLVEAQLQGASLSAANLQGALLQSAQLQGADLSHAELRGASLHSADLQGARLDDADLRGAFLSIVKLQGTSLRNAQLQGAYLEHAQLQGASLWRAQLQGASLSGLFVWRSYTPDIDITGAYVDDVITEPKYKGLDCAQISPCNWSADSYASLLQLITYAVPKRSLRRGIALIEVGRLYVPPKSGGNEPGELESNREPWAEFKKKGPTREEYYKTLADILRDTGCKSGYAPYVVAGLVRNLDRRFDFKKHHEASRVADAFLDEANCPGARGLSETEKAELREMRDREPPPPAAPAPEAEATK